MDYQPIGKVTKSVVDSLREQPHGLTMTGGQTTTNPSGVTIKTRSQAIRIKSEMREQVRLNTSGEWMARVTSGEEVAEYLKKDLPCQIDLMEQYPKGYRVTAFRKSKEPTKSHMVEFHSKPAHRETILAHLQRLSMHRHLKGDQTQQAFLLADYTRRLSEIGVTELQIFDAVEHLIEHGESDFFPTYSALKKEIGLG